MPHLEFLSVRSESTGSFGVSKNIRGLLLLGESIEDKVRNTQKLLRDKILLATAFNSMEESNVCSTYEI